LARRLLRYLEVFVAVFLISLVLLSAITLLARVPSNYTYDQYFALYTLGATGTAEHYFPGDVTDILPGATMSWYVGVYNHMGSVELVKVLIKILNGTMIGPDQLNNMPSGRGAFYEMTRLLVINATWTIPLSWRVFNATKTPNATTIHSMVLNGYVLTENVEVSALYGYDFRIVVELWVYDEASGNFGFAWDANGVERSVWNQLWFNMTRTSLIP